MALPSPLLHLPLTKPFLSLPKRHNFPPFKASFNFSLHDKTNLNVKSVSFAATRTASSLVVDEELEEFEAVNIAEDVTQL
ncbi:hypothetical protein V6N11_045865 [Hibiscus sabdariffa]